MRDVSRRRWRQRLALGSTPTSGAGPPAAATATAAAARDPAGRLRARIGTTALAFRGYDQHNLGRTGELLAHPVYGPFVRSTLAEASELCRAVTDRPSDLIAYVEAGAPGGPEAFGLDVALIVAAELAQLRILDSVFGVPTRSARLSLGYSIGELTALVASGVFRLDEILPVPLALADDCAALAERTRMAVVFTRGPALQTLAVERLCEAVRSEGHGLIGPSAFLAPNTALILGEGDTLDRFERRMPEFLPHSALLRRKEHRWPPLHSPLVWHAHIPNRTAQAVYRIGGGRTAPSPTILSCVTGRASYDDHNARATLIQWTDAPQRLWDALDGTLAAGVETVVHVGPAPHLIPATLARLGQNVRRQLGTGLTHAVVAGLNRQAWLTPLLPARTSLLRAPFLEHVILEDWLLAQPDPG